TTFSGGAFPVTTQDQAAVRPQIQLRARLPFGYSRSDLRLASFAKLLQAESRNSQKHVLRSVRSADVGRHHFAHLRDPMGSRNARLGLGGRAVRPGDARPYSQGFAVAASGTRVQAIR